VKGSGYDVPSKQFGDENSLRGGMNAPFPDLHGVKKWMLFVLLVLPAFGYAQDCSRVHTGKFFIQDVNHPPMTIVRTDSTQEEFVASLGVHLKFKLKWLSDCAYILTDGECIAGDPRSIGNPNEVLWVDILTVNDKGYTYKARIVGVDFEISGTVLFAE
jgi:hypothetical protein